LSEEQEQQNLINNPRLVLTDHRFTLTCAAASAAEKEAAKAALMEAVEEKDMAPFYSYLCETYSWTADAALATKLAAANAAKLATLEEVIKDADENLGETEIREAYLAKAEYLCMIGDKEGAVAGFKVAKEKTVSLGHRLDIVFNLIRLGMFYSDSELTVKNLELAQTLMDEGGDWDRRNRLKVYSGVHNAAIREFSQASEKFLSTVSTFTSLEMMGYSQFVELTVLVSMITLPRVELNKKVLLGPEIQEMLHQSPVIKGFLESLYKCDYAAFFTHLGQVDEFMMKSRILSPHRRHYVREMRIMAYTQLLESYRSVTLDSMAESFGVSVEFIDTELSHFIALKRLNCKIDKVAGIVMTTRVDQKNSQYQTTLKSGDVLLSQIQKLSQMVNM